MTEIPFYKTTRGLLPFAIRAIPYAIHAAKPPSEALQHFEACFAGLLQSM